MTSLEHKLADATTVQEAMKYYDPTDQVTVFDMGGPTPEYAGQKAMSRGKGLSTQKQVPLAIAKRPAPMRG